MKERLLNHLRCPQCGGEFKCEVVLKDEDFEWPEVMEGSLTCTDCARTYPVRGGIPRLLLNELSEDVERTVDGFGWEWSHFNTQIKDTYMSDASHFLDFISPVTSEFFREKVVLDAGCGMGRFLKLGAEFGSDDIIGIDLSRAVEAAYQNTRHLPNAHVVQADIQQLPCGQIFDYIFSIGVLHHMPDPSLGFARLIPHLKTGGCISVWVYAMESNGWIERYLTPLRKYVTSHLPHRVLYLLSLFVGMGMYLGLKLVYKPINEYRWGKKLRARLPYSKYLYYTSQLDYAGVVSVVFDHLVPRLTMYVSENELETWFKEAGLSDVAITLRNDNSWRGHGLNRPTPGLTDTRQALASSRQLEGLSST